MGNNPLLAEPPDTWRMNVVNSFENCPSIKFFFVVGNVTAISAPSHQGALHIFSYR